MGLAASQGRLLLLTAKKSDLEFRAQSISQSRLILAQQQEGISRKYAEKTSNRTYKLKVFDKDGDKPTYVDFNFENLWSQKGPEGNKKYSLVDSSTGMRMISKKEDIMASKQVDNGGGGFDESTYSFRETTKNGQNVVEVVDRKSRDVVETFMVDEKLGKDKGGTDSYLKYLLDTGSVYLNYRDKDGMELKTTTIAGDANFSDEYYTDDDAEAKAEYDMEMTKVKIKDQRLELDLKGVETQHKAVETETESVQKIIQKNIEVGFKTFS